MGRTFKQLNTSTAWSKLTPRAAYLRPGHVHPAKLVHPCSPAGLQSRPYLRRLAAQAQAQAQAQAHANEPKPKPKPVGVARICSSHRFAEPQTWLLNLRVRHPEAAEVSPATFSGARTACVKGLECQCPSAVWVLVPVRCGLSVCFAFVCVHIPNMYIHIL